ncbi:hypothetical protein BKA67DRAFT_690032 [Truncatella angustata]|uniref:Uncharacterized protein n=1 Tax=Truncatella angustata TaxID=152316 RepID=A0A9P8ZYI7_9PEZI|nr:uncharacterized protein BKA67DRAFT_690032 [Truncatella angustata]KAH6655207.1 hypothetical protein BKA67DRAFT_690032 [Truncatella angustata]
MLLCLKQPISSELAASPEVTTIHTSCTLFYCLRLATVLMANPLVNLPATRSTAPNTDSSNFVGSMPSRQRISSRLQQSTIAQNSRLRQLWTSRWIHPQRKAYLHALVDTSNCWSLILTIFYINGLDQALCNGIPPGVEFYRIHTAWQIILAAVVGGSLGSLFKTIGEWNEQIPRPGKNLVVVGRVHLPLWLYMCLTLVGTFTLSFMASGGLRKMRSYARAAQAPSEQFPTNWAWYGVVTAICDISLLAVAADAIIRHKMMVSQERDVVDDTVDKRPGQSGSA